MVANPEICKAQIAEKIFCAFDLRKGLDGDGSAVGDARGETGERRFPPIWEIKAIGQLADIGFGKSSFQKWRADVPFLRSAHARAMIASIVEIKAVKNDVEVFLGRKCGDFGIELGLAEIAAVAGIGRVAGRVHLRCLDELKRSRKDSGEILNTLKLALRERGTDAGCGEDIFAPERVEGHF